MLVCLERVQARIERKVHVNLEQGPDDWIIDFDDLDRSIGKFLIRLCDVARKRRIPY